MRATVYFETADGEIRRLVLTYNSAIDAEHFRRIVRNEWKVDTPEQVSFGPVGKPWSLMR